MVCLSKADHQDVAWGLIILSLKLLMIICCCCCGLYGWILYDLYVKEEGALQLTTR